MYRKLILINILFLTFSFHQGLAAVLPKIVIANTSFLSGDVKRVGDDSSSVNLRKGDIIFKGDEIKVSGRGFVLVKYIDGSRLQFGSNTRAYLDNFEYNNTRRVGMLEVTLVKGCFVFKSGLITRFARGKHHSVFKTPSAIIGVMGSELELHVSNAGATTVIHRSGFMTVTDVTGRNSVTLNKPGNASVVLINGKPSFNADVTKLQQSVLQSCLPASAN